jgi:hypothetical protein
MRRERFGDAAMFAFCADELIVGGAYPLASLPADYPVGHRLPMPTAARRIGASIPGDYALIRNEGLSNQIM